MKDTITKLHILYIHIVSTYEEWKEHIWNNDLDSYFCCNGDMCGCGGETVRGVYKL